MNKDCGCMVSHDGPCESSRIIHGDTDQGNSHPTKRVGTVITNFAISDPNHPNMSRAAYHSDPFEPSEAFIPDGYFRIGEEVEYRKKGGDGYSRGLVGVFCKESAINNADDYEVRRPAYQPKDGESVLASDGGIAWPVTASGPETIYSHGRNDFRPLFGMKPFDPAKIGRPWSEV